LEGFRTPRRLENLAAPERFRVMVRSRRQRPYFPLCGRGRAGLHLDVLEIDQSIPLDLVRYTNAL